MACARSAYRISEKPFRDAAAAPRTSHRDYQDRACRLGNIAGTARPLARSAARPPTHALRYGDDQGGRLLPRHRKLLAAFYRAHAWSAASDTAGLLAARFADVH